MHGFAFPSWTERRLYPEHVAPSLTADSSVLMSAFPAGHGFTTSEAEYEDRSRVSLHSTSIQFLRAAKPKKTTHDGTDHCYTQPCMLSLLMAGKAALWQSHWDAALSNLGEPPGTVNIPYSIADLLSKILSAFLLAMHSFSFLSLQGPQPLYRKRPSRSELIKDINKNKLLEPVG